MFIVLGDWSDDGHGKSEKILIESNIEREILQEAYKKSVKSTGIGFNCNEKSKIKICAEYDDNKLTTNTFKILENLKCPFDKIGLKDQSDNNITEDTCEEFYFDNDTFLNLLMWFIGLSVKDFEWKKIKEEIPCFNGYWDKNLNVSFGYGLYF